MFSRNSKQNGKGTQALSDRKMKLKYVQLYIRHGHGSTVNFQIYEYRTLKATKHDKYENITGCV
jgi:hypothetical protein